VTEGGKALVFLIKRRRIFGICAESAGTVAIQCTLSGAWEGGIRKKKKKTVGGQLEIVFGKREGGAMSGAILCDDARGLRRERKARVEKSSRKRRKSVYRVRKARRN